LPKSISIGAQDVILHLDEEKENMLGFGSA
jgi:hypothetical protein